MSRRKRFGCWGRARSPARIPRRVHVPVLNGQHAWAVLLARGGGPSCRTCLLDLLEMYGRSNPAASLGQEVPEPDVRASRNAAPPWSKPPMATFTGQRGNYGTIFKITPSGTLTTLYSFCSQSACTDGAIPVALVQATNGDLYGNNRGGRNRGHRRWYGLQNHPEWHADDAIQLLLPKRVQGRRNPCRARAGHQWGLLRDNLRWRDQRWEGLQPVCRSGPVCENTAYLRQGGSGGQDSGHRSDGCN